MGQIVVETGGRSQGTGVVETPVLPRYDVGVMGPDRAQEEAPGLLLPGRPGQKVDPAREDVVLAGAFHGLVHDAVQQQVLIAAVANHAPPLPTAVLFGESQAPTALQVAGVGNPPATHLGRLEALHQLVGIEPEPLQPVRALDVPFPEVAGAIPGLPEPPAPEGESRLQVGAIGFHRMGAVDHPVAVGQETCHQAGAAGRADGVGRVAA